MLEILNRIQYLIESTDLSIESIINFHIRRKIREFITGVEQIPGISGTILIQGKLDLSISKIKETITFTLLLNEVDVTVNEQIQSLEDNFYLKP